MEENITVQQLSQALNQLLDAYEDLQKKNTTLKEEMENLELENEELKDQISLLSSTTSEQNTEMDAMISRIESILGAKASSEDTEEIQEPKTTVDDIIPTEEADEDEKEEGKDSESSTYSDQPDLGRMQALLNGFNN